MQLPREPHEAFHGINSTFVCGVDCQTLKAIKGLMDCSTGARIMGEDQRDLQVYPEETSVQVDNDSSNVQILEAAYCTF